MPKQRLVPAWLLAKLPDDISDQQGASMMLKGGTAQYLLRQIYEVKAGDAIVIHAAAGGVGLIVCQWAKHLGATVIGTVGSDDKAELAKAHGCDHPIVYAGRILPRGCVSSPTARAYRWFTIRWARTPSWARSIAYNRAG